MNLISDIENFKKRQVTLKEDYFKNYLEHCEEFFDKHSEVESIAISIWAPYFNDGDPCIPHIRNWHVKFIGDLGSKLENLEGMDYGYKNDYGFTINELYIPYEDKKSDMEADFKRSHIENDELYDALWDLFSYAQDFEDFWMAKYGYSSTIKISRDLKLDSSRCVISHD